MKKRTSKKMLPLGICIMLVLTSTIVVSNAQETSTKSLSKNQNTELKISFFGSIRLLFVPAVGYGIDNIGDETAYNVTATFTLDGGFNGKIHLTDTNDYTEILPGYLMITSWPHAVDGFGPLTITVNVDASNAEAIEKTARGFQIGLRTFIFG